MDRRADSLLEAKAPGSVTTIENLQLESVQPHKLAGSDASLFARGQAADSKSRKNENEKKVFDKISKMSNKQKSPLLGQYKGRQTDSSAGGKYSNQDLRSLLTRNDKVNLQGQTQAQRPGPQQEESPPQNLQRKSQASKEEMQADINEEKDEAQIEDELRQILKRGEREAKGSPNSRQDSHRLMDATSNPKHRTITPQATTSGRQVSSVLEHLQGQRLQPTEEGMAMMREQESLGPSPRTQHRVIISNLQTPLQETKQKLDHAKHLQHKTPKNKSKNLVAFSFMQGDLGDLLKDQNEPASVDPSKKDSTDVKFEDETTQKTGKPNLSNERRWQQEMMETVDHRQIMNKTSSEGTLKHRSRKQNKSTENGEEEKVEAEPAVPNETEQVHRPKKEKGPAQRIPMTIKKIGLRDEGAPRQSLMDLQSSHHLNQMSSSGTYRHYSSISPCSRNLANDRNSKAHFTFLPPQMHQNANKRGRKGLMKPGDRPSQEQRLGKELSARGGVGLRPTPTGFLNSHSALQRQSQANVIEHSTGDLEGLLTPNHLLKPAPVGDGRVVKYLVRSPYAAKRKTKMPEKASGRNSGSFDSGAGSRNELGAAFHVGSSANPSVIVQPMGRQKSEQPYEPLAMPVTEMSRTEQHLHLQTHESKERGSISFGNSINPHTNFSNDLLSSGHAVTPTITPDGNNDSALQSVMNSRHPGPNTPIQIIIPASDTELQQTQQRQAVAASYSAKRQVSSIQNAVKPDEEPHDLHKHVKAYQTESKNSAMNADLEPLKAAGKAREQKTKKVKQKGGLSLNQLLNNKAIKLNRNSEKSSDDASKLSEEEKTVSMMSGIVYNANRRYKREDGLLHGQEEVTLNKLQLAQLLSAANNQLAAVLQQETAAKALADYSEKGAAKGVGRSPQERVNALRGRRELPSPLQNQDLREKLLANAVGESTEQEGRQSPGAHTDHGSKKWQAAQPLPRGDQSKRQIFAKKSLPVTALSVKERDPALNEHTELPESTFIQPAGLEFEMFQATEMAQNHVQLESQFQTQNDSAIGSKTEQNYSNSKATPMGQIYNKFGQDTLSAFNVQEHNEQESRSQQERRSSPRIADIKIHQIKAKQEAKNELQRKYAATSQGFFPQAAPFVPTQKLMNSTFKPKAGATFYKSRKSDSPLDPRPERGGQQSAVVHAQIINFKKQQQQQYGFKFNTRRPTSIDILEGQLGQFLPQVRPNLRLQTSASPSNAIKKSNLPNPKQRMKQQTIAGFVTSIVTQPINQCQLVKIQMSGERMFDSYKEKLQQSKVASRETSAKKVSKVKDSGTMNPAQTGQFAVMASEGMSTIIDRDSHSRKRDSDEAKTSSLAGKIKVSSKGEVKMSQQIPKDRTKEQFFGTIERGKSKYIEENQSSVNQGSLLSDDTNQRRKEVELKFGKHSLGGRDGPDKSQEDSSLEQELMGRATYQHPKNAGNGGAHQHLRIRDSPSNQKPSVHIQRHTGNLTEDSISRDRGALAEQLGEQLGLHDGSRIQEGSQLPMNIVGNEALDGQKGAFADLLKQGAHSTVNTPAKERGFSALVESTNEQGSQKTNHRALRERLKKRVSMINDRDVGLFQPEPNEPMLKSYFAKTPVQGRIEFTDPLSPATPQTTMISLVNKNVSIISNQNDGHRNEDSPEQQGYSNAGLGRPGLLPVVKKKTKVEEEVESLQNLRYFRVMNDQVRFPLDQILMRQVAENSQPPYISKGGKARHKTPFLSKKVPPQWPKKTGATQSAFDNAPQHLTSRKTQTRRSDWQQPSPKSSFNPKSTILPRNDPNSDSPASQERAANNVEANLPLSYYQLHTIRCQEGILNKNIKKLFISKDQLHTMVNQGLQHASSETDRAGQHGSGRVNHQHLRDLIAKQSSLPRSNTFRKGKQSVPREMMSSRQDNDWSVQKMKRGRQRKVNLPFLIQESSTLHQGRAINDYRTIQASPSSGIPSSTAKIPDLIPVKDYIKQDAHVLKVDDPRPLVAELKKQLPNDCFKKQNLQTAVEATQRAQQIIRVGQLQKKKTSKLSASEQEMLIMRALKSVHTSTVLNNFSVQNTSVLETIGEMRLQNSSDVTMRNNNFEYSNSLSIQDKLNLTLTSTVNSPPSATMNISKTFQRPADKDKPSIENTSKSKAPFTELPANHEGTHKEQLLRQLNIQEHNDKIEDTEDALKELLHQQAKGTGASAQRAGDPDGLGSQRLGQVQHVEVGRDSAPEPIPEAAEQEAKRQEEKQSSFRGSARAEGPLKGGQQEGQLQRTNVESLEAKGQRQYNRTELMVRGKLIEQVEKDGVMRAAGAAGEGKGPNDGRLTDQKKSSSEVDVKEEHQIRTIDVTSSRRKLGAFPENSGSGGVTSINVDYDGQLKHIYSQANNERTDGRYSSNELSNAPIRQVRVATNGKSGLATRPAGASNAASTPTRRPGHQTGDSAHWRHSKERVSQKIKKTEEQKPQELKKFVNQRKFLMKDIDEVTMQTQKREAVSIEGPKEGSLTNQSQARTILDRVAMAQLASSGDAGAEGRWRSKRIQVESALGRGPPTEVYPLTPNAHLPLDGSGRQRGGSQLSSTGGMQKDLGRKGDFESPYAQFSALDPAAAAKGDKGGRRSNLSAHFEPNDSRCHHSKDTFEDQDPDLQLTKKQTEELKALQLVLQQDEPFQAMKPIDAVTGKSFTSTYDINQIIGQSGKDLKLMHLEQKYITNKHRKNGLTQKALPRGFPLDHVPQEVKDFNKFVLEFHDQYRNVPPHLISNRSIHSNSKLQVPARTRNQHLEFAAAKQLAQLNYSELIVSLNADLYEDEREKLAKDRARKEDDPRRVSALSKHQNQPVALAQSGRKPS